MGHCEVGLGVELRRGMWDNAQAGCCFACRPVNNPAWALSVRDILEPSMRFSVAHAGLVCASLTTAFLHISLYPDFGYFDWIVLNGFGTLTLLSAYFMPSEWFRQRREGVFWSMAAYVTLTILLWLIFGDKTFELATTAAIGYYAKLAELMVLFFLWASQPEFLS